MVNKAASKATSMITRQYKFVEYFSAVKYLESLGNIGAGYQKTDLSAHSHPEMFLERMQDFLDLLGNPEKSFKYIHITGTAGKGSVATAVHFELVKAGKKSGLFTSPFTVSTIEKIQVGDKYIDPVVFAKLTDSIKPVVDRMLLSGRHGAPSYFEMMLAIALMYFNKEKCEYVVLEVGLGGSYDATNIIRKPTITAITNISLDHTNILGSTRECIAKDKAGIIKKGSEFFTTENDQKILKIFEEKCMGTGAKYHSINVHSVDYDVRNRLLVGSICQSLGIVNVAEEVGPLPSMPARFEIVERSPLVIIDGAHNPSKISSTIVNLRKLKYRSLDLVVAVSADKDWKEMLKLIAPFARRIFATRFSVPGRVSVNPKELFIEAKLVASKGCKVELFADPVMAFDIARRTMNKSDVLLVAGSFYLAGDIRALYCPESQILKNRDSKLHI